jgi:hypothetical protein
MDEDLIKVLDKRTSDLVMQDLTNCIDKWSKLDLDSETTVVTLLQFTIELILRHSDNTFDAMGLISGVLLEKLENNEIDQDLMQAFFDFNESQNGSVH